jgi:hypothetical protein
MPPVRRRAGGRFGRRLRPPPPELTMAMITEPGDQYTSYRPARFSVSLALTRAIELLTKNFFTIYVISALATLPYTLYSWFTAAEPASGTAFLAGMLNVVLVSLSEAMIVYATFQALRGRGIDPRASIARGLQRFGAVFVASILIGVVTLLGFLLLIVPGLIVMVVFYVAIPACVVEQLGPSASLSRSSQLTSGYRWQIFGAAFAVLIAQIVVESIIAAMLHRPETLVAFEVVTFLWTALGSAYQAVLVTLIYHDLRVAKEGIDIEQLASVFD